MLGSRNLKQSAYAPVVLCLSLAAIGVWFNLTGYTNTFSVADAAVDSSHAPRYAYYFGRIVITSAFLLAPRLFERLFPALSLCMPLVMLFNTMGYALAYNQTMFSSSVLGGVTSFIIGVAYMWVDASLYVMLARVVKPQRVVLVILAAQVLEQLGGMLASIVVPEVLQVFICCACSLVPVVALLGIGLPANAVWDKKNIEGPARRHFFVLIAMVGIAVVALGATSSVGSWGKIRVDYGAPDAALAFFENILSCMVASSCAWLVLRKSGQHPISYRYQGSFLVVSCGFLIAICLGSAPDLDWVAVDVIMTGIEYFAHVLFWVVIVQAIVDVDKPPYFVAGLGMFAYSVCATLWVYALDTNEILSTLAVLALACSLILTVSVHPRLLYERGFSALTRKRDMNEYGIKGEPYIPVEQNSAAAADAIAKRSSVLSKKYSLTQREEQVLGLLAQGRSKTVICKMLVLSEGTVKTHVSNIYGKMSVKSHQELLDIVYGASSDESEDGK